MEIPQNIASITMDEHMAMEKTAITAKLSGVMKEFGEDSGIIYADKPEDALKKAVELIDEGAIREHGSKARGFVGKCGWDDVVDEFEGILEEVVQSD